MIGPFHLSFGQSISSNPFVPLAGRFKKSRGTNSLSGPTILSRPKTRTNGLSRDILFVPGLYNELFRTNNNAEAFHSSLRHVFFRAHPQFGEFVGKIIGVMETAEAEYEAERLRPKQIDRRLQSSYKNIKNVVDNFYHDASLGLPLPKLLERIGDILHGDVRFEERYEQGDEATFEPVGDEFCTDGVPMEIADE